MLAIATLKTSDAADDNGDGKSVVVVVFMIRSENRKGTTMTRSIMTPVETVLMVMAMLMILMMAAVMIRNLLRRP